MNVIGVDRITKGNEEETSNVRDEDLPYPKSVSFIVVTEFCERFSYYGMRAVLTIYMRNILNFSEDLATTIYHVFLLHCYALPVFGGILADSFIGKYKTILYLSSVYALGNIVLTVASIRPFHFPVVWLSLVGLLLMAVGTGGIKVLTLCSVIRRRTVSAPSARKKLKQFFSIFLFAVSVGNMVSTVSTPLLRRDVGCFGDDTCYPLAFAIPGALLLVAISVFVGGRYLYIIKKPEENLILKVVKCALFAIKGKLRRKGEEMEESHWLDYAKPQFDEDLIEDSKGLFRVLVYYLPVPMFFALYEQLGSRWTLQAMKMNGYIGRFVIKPDQMQVANAILLFLSIPFFEIVVYPLFRKCNLLVQPLQKMVVGGVLASLAFLAAGIVETKIDSSNVLLHGPNSRETLLNFINTISCPIKITESNLKGNGVTSGSHLKNEELFISAKQNFISPPLPPEQRHIVIRITIGNAICRNLSSWEGELKLIDGGLQSVVIAEAKGIITLESMISPENVEKSKEGNAKLRVLLIDLPSLPSSAETATPIGIELDGAGLTPKYESLNYTNSTNQSSFLRSSRVFELEPDTYNAQVVWKKIHGNGSSFTTRLAHNVSVKTGGSYILSIHGNAPNIMTITPPNHVHMLWLLPQYVLIAWAEVLFIISGMEFSFTEAPATMKSVVQSCWHLANAVGNAIVIIFAQMSLHQTYEFFGFSALMALDTLMLCLMAMRYSYVNEKKRSISTIQAANEIESQL